MEKNTLPAGGWSLSIHLVVKLQLPAPAPAPGIVKPQLPLSTPNTKPMKPMNLSSTLRLLRRGLLAALLAAPAAHAADGVWNGSSDTLWSTPANWDSGIADDTGFTADFNSLDPLTDQFVDLDSPRTIGNLIFGDTDPATTPPAGP